MLPFLRFESTLLTPQRASIIEPFVTFSRFRAGPECLRIRQRLADSVQVNQWKTVRVRYASGRAKFW